MSGQDQEGFLGRWSRLKQQARELPEVERAVPSPTGGDAERAATPVPPADRDAITEQQPNSEASPGERKLTREDFADVDFEALDFQSDYGRFMQDGVPDDVRNQALRKLWASNPVLANIDGLDDYCEDYTDAAVVPKGVLKTAYRVGRGFLSDTEVAEWEALGKAERIASDDRLAALARGAADEDGGGAAAAAVPEAAGEGLAACETPSIAQEEPAVAVGSSVAQGAVAEESSAEPQQQDGEPGPKPTRET